MYLNTLCLCRHKTKAVYKFWIPYTHFHPLSHAYLSAVPCSRTSTSPVTLQLSSIEGQVGFPDADHQFPKDLHCWVSRGTWKICPFSKVSDAAKILQDRQDKKRMAEEQDICPKITHLSGRIEIITWVFCNLQYRSPTRPALIKVSVIVQTD